MLQNSLLEAELTSLFLNTSIEIRAPFRYFSRNFTSKDVPLNDAQRNRIELEVHERFVHSNFSKRRCNLRKISALCFSFATKRTQKCKIIWNRLLDSNSILNIGRLIKHISLSNYVHKTIELLVDFPICLTFSVTCGSYNFL